MDIETVIEELENYTDKELKILVNCISAEQQSREEGKLKEIVEKTCTALKELDTALDDSVEVTVSSYGVDFTGYLDLSELCRALRDYIS